MAGESRKLRSMVSVRLAPEEEVAVRREAARRGETLSTFFRRVALAEVAGGNGAGVIGGEPLSVGASVVATYSGSPGFVEMNVTSPMAVVMAESDTQEASTVGH